MVVLTRCQIILTWSARAGAPRNGREDRPRGGYTGAVCRPRLLLGALLLAACGPTDNQVAGAVLLSTPLVYLLAMAVVSAVYGAWQSMRPDLRFGREVHVAAVVGAVVLAGYGGRYADADLLALALWFFGTCVLGLWLLVARVTLRSGWGFRWGGIVVTALLAAPMLLALVMPELRRSLVEHMTGIYIFVGGLGVVPGTLLIVMLLEASRVGRAVRAASLDEPP